MAYLLSIATAVPPHVVTREDMLPLGPGLFPELFATRPEAFAELIDNTRIERRHTVRPLAEIARPRTLAETSRWYAEATRELGRRALDEALAKAGVAPGEITAIVTTSSTGFMIPSLDNYLIEECGLSPATRRYPFATLGCAGGAAGLVRAAEILAGRGPEAKVAVVAVETPSLTFRPGDRSMKNAISSVLFGDGGAAVILGNRPPAHPTVRVRAGRSWVFPSTYGVMGFDLVDDGFEVVLGPEVPRLCARDLPRLVGELAREGSATRSDLSFLVIHPGGRRVLEAIQGALGVPEEEIRPSWDVLARHGNMSSPTVLFVLAEVLGQGTGGATAASGRRPPRPGTLGVLGAFGPGFAAELALLEGVGGSR